MAGRARVLMDTRSVALSNMLNPDVRKGMDALQVVSAYYKAGLASQRVGGDGNKAMAHFNQARMAAAGLPAAQQAVALRVLTLAQAEVLLNNRQVTDAAQMLSRDLASGRAGLKLSARPELMAHAHIAMALPEGPGQQDAWTDAAARLQTHVSNKPAQKRFRQPDAADVIELSVMDSRLKTWLRQQREDLREESGR